MPGGRDPVRAGVQVTDDRRETIVLGAAEWRDAVQAIGVAAQLLPQSAFVVMQHWLQQE